MKVQFHIEIASGNRVLHVWQTCGQRCGTRVAVVRLLRRRSNMTLKGVSRDPTGNQKEVPASITNQLSAKRHPLSHKPICNGGGDFFLGEGGRARRRKAGGNVW